MHAAFRSTLQFLIRASDSSSFFKTLVDARVRSSNHTDAKADVDGDHHCRYGHGHFAEMDIQHCTLGSSTGMRTDFALEHDGYGGRESSEQRGKRSLPPVRGQRALIDRASPGFEIRHCPKTPERSSINAKLRASVRRGSVTEPQYSPYELELTDRAKYMLHLKNLADRIMDLGCPANSARVEAGTKGDKERARKCSAELSERRGPPDQAPHSTADSGYAIEEVTSITRVVG